MSRPGTHLGSIHHESVVHQGSNHISGSKWGKTGPKWAEVRSRQIWKTFISLDRASKTSQKTHRNLYLKMYLSIIMRR